MTYFALFSSIKGDKLFRLAFPEFFKFSLIFFIFLDKASIFSKLLLICSWVFLSVKADSFLNIWKGDLFDIFFVFIVL